MNEVDTKNLLIDLDERTTNAFKRIHSLYIDFYEFKKQVEGNAIMSCEAQHLARKCRECMVKMVERIDDFEKQLIKTEEKNNDEIN